MRPDFGRVAIVMPTYNERDNIEAIVSRLRAAVPYADLLIVDDNSPDGTGELADKIALGDAQVAVLHRPGKSGLGTAYLAGFRQALAAGYGAIVEMDADGSHQPEDLPRMLGALARADLVLGSRWVRGGRVVNWPRSREILSRLGNAYAQAMLQIGLRDATGGYRVYRAATLRAIAREDIRSQGYCFQIDLAWRAVRAGLAVAEVPITFMEREHGRSKMSRAIIAEAFWRVTVWGIADRWRSLTRRSTRVGRHRRSALP